MKKTNTLIVLLAITSLSFGLNNKSAMSVNNDFDLSFNSNQDVYGIQFDMRYDATIISVEELTNASSLVDGIDIYAREKEPGFVRVLMFSMNLEKIASANQLTNVIDFDITPLTTNASLNPVISFDNIIVAGENGQELDYPSSFEYQVSNSDLVPTSTALSNVYPNPFNPSTTIDYTLSTSSDVTLSIYDMQGRMVRSLVSSNQDAGTYNVIWNGLNETGEQSASGIYLVMMEANGNIYQQSITLLK